jgi:formylglycine-generating enzyme required for sulfatase activity
VAKVKCPKCDLPNPAGQTTCSRCRTLLPQVSVEPDPSRSGNGGVAREIAFRRGQIIANRYTVIDLIGRGGMGCIYRVHDNTLNEDVALKTLLPQFVQDKVVVERFYNEARIARALSHANIVRVHDIGFAGQILYISMEWLRGHSLRGALDKLPAGQRLPIRLTLRIIDQLCAALEYAHQYTVHRDIKPENVMILPDGSVKLMDFGISKLMTQTRLTAASMVMGTPYYMSPEQLKDSSSVDARADIYSVGVMLYEMLTGNLPTGVLKPASQLLREVPPALDPIVAKCVEPDPRNRYASATELREALRPIRELIESGTDPRAIAQDLERRRDRRVWMRKLAGAALIAVILGAAAWAIGWLENRRRDALAEQPAPVEAAQPAESSQTGTVGFADLEVAIPEARRKAEAAAGGDERLQAFVRAGDARWQEALRMHERVASDPNSLSKALNLGWQALQYYAGVYARPTGMVFVPPGRVDIPLDPRRPGLTASVEVDGFFIDQTEVTNASYMDFVRRQEWREPPYDEVQGAAYDPRRDDLPVTMVTGFDAAAYAAFRGKTLPTEAQWLRATYGADASAPARFDLPRAFPWGDAPDPAAANTYDASDLGPRPTPPQEYDRDRTDAGCYDMAGNVAEWTRSFFSLDPAEAEKTMTLADAEDLPFNRRLVVKGDSFMTAPSPLQTRFPVEFEQRFPNLGFRCVLEIPRNLAALK